MQAVFSIREKSGAANVTEGRPCKTRGSDGRVKAYGGAVNSGREAGLKVGRTFLSALFSSAFRDALRIKTVAGFLVPQFSNVADATSCCIPGHGLCSLRLLDVSRQECLLHPETWVLSMTWWMRAGIAHTQVAGDASSSSWIFGGPAHILQPLTQGATTNFGFAAESRNEVIALGKPHERHRYAPHTEVDFLAFIIVAVPIDSPRFLLLF